MTVPEQITMVGNTVAAVGGLVGSLYAVFGHGRWLANLNETQKTFAQQLGQVQTQVNQNGTQATINK